MKRKNVKIKTKRKGKRGKHKSVKSVEKTLIFGGVNVDGARGKWGTVKRVVKNTGVSVWMMQETKVSQEGSLKLDGFITYEHLRNDSEGGGLALSARTELSPALVNDGGEEVEAITVDIHVKNMTISITNAYGPQEYEKIEKKNAFWSYLHNEAQRAESNGKGFLLQGDMNSWLGPKIIPGDKRAQNKNGKMFEDFIKTNNLIVLNSLPFCKGLTTRARKYNGKLVESTIDFYVVCQHVLPFVTRMEIDSDKKYILTNYNNVRYGGKSIDADHSTMVVELSITVTPEKT